MIDHTIQQIEETEKYFNDKGFSLLEKTVAGRDLRYYVMPQSMNLDLQDFIFRVTNDASKKYLIGVSDSVPEKLQPYFALAEYIEFIELGINRKERVMEAEKIVLSVIPDELSKEYIQRKVKLLQTELKLDSSQPKYALGSDGRKEFNAAIKFLESKVE
jgi:hypothetical protein